MRNLIKFFRYSWMYRLRNNTLAIAVHIVIMTLSKYRDELEDTPFADRFDSLTRRLSSLDKIKYKSRKHDTTVILEGLQEARTQMISEIRSRLKANKRSRYTESSVPGSLLYNWFNGRVPITPGSTQLEITSHIQSVANDLESRADVSQAVSNLDMVVWFSDLIDINQQYVVLYADRGQSIGESTDSYYVDVAEIRSKAMLAVQSLFNSMKDLVIDDGFEAHSAMILSLYKNLEPFRAIVTRRHNANKSEINSNDAPNSNQEGKEADSSGSDSSNTSGDSSAEAKQA